MVEICINWRKLTQTCADLCHPVINQFIQAVEFHSHKPPPYAFSYLRTLLIF